MPDTTETRREAAGPLLPPADVAQLRSALLRFTVDEVADLLGPVGRAAQLRGDLAGVARAVAGDGGPTATLVELFLLGADVADRDAAAAFAPLSLDRAVAGGLVRRAGDRVRALLEVRPYAEAGAAPGDAAGAGKAGEAGAATGQPWWVVSDLGSDVRPGPLTADHVLGIGNAALTLAQATPRGQVGRALDIGTGCGVQALHLARHAESVTATDISGRALRYAATTAALSGQRWELRRGSFVEPVADRRYDLVVANPPFVVSPGAGTATGEHPAAEFSIAEYDYRDSGRAGDDACRDLTRGIFSILDDGGTGQLLANWIVPTDGDWQERVAGWFPAGSTGWVWQREIADLGEYAALWLRDAGHTPGTPEWIRRYDAWLDWFTARGVAAVGMGMITLRRDDAPDRPADVVAEDVPQAHEQPIGAEVAAWFDRRRAVTGSGAAELLHARLAPARDLVRTRHDLLAAGEGWRSSRATLRQSHGMRWEIEVDDTVANIVAACAAGASPLTALEVLAATTGDDTAELARRFTPVLADLVQRGVLVPDTGSTG